MIHIVLQFLIRHIVHNSYVYIFILQHFKTVGEKKAVSHGVTNVLEIFGLSTSVFHVYMKIHVIIILKYN